MPERPIRRAALAQLLNRARGQTADHFTDLMIADKSFVLFEVNFKTDRKASIMSTQRRVWPVMLACVAFFEPAPQCLSQDLSPAVHSSTEVASDSRYELIQSPLVRFSGVVDQLVSDIQGSSYFWLSVKMDKHAAEEFKLYTDNRVHFQVFTSGIIVKNTFLMDVDTGKTWVLVKDQKDQQWWEAVD